ncbi:hypothetical protein C7974DRAFT_128841 [Boeremia exigua]|uniref:uncharacterized protein n=1 Tax=Boeremia exigua TaxID=749465 RepID=UPI001E8E47B5|nr:uncharacterized protein C7974DRAFT_128841 [Boeremia exigua]KAH6639307.1 hypothetical protein C7974DRAFT_128841 [Boeremia exigua]
MFRLCTFLVCRLSFFIPSPTVRIPRSSHQKVGDVISRMWRFHFSEPASFWIGPTTLFWIDCEIVGCEPRAGCGRRMVDTCR